MAFSHGSKAVLKLGDSSNALQDISAYLTDMGLPQDLDQAEVTTFGDTVKAYISGLSNATIPLSGVWDPAVDAILAGILGPNFSNRNFEYYPAGEGTGNIKYSGQCNLSKYEVHTPVNGEASFSAELQCNSAITRAVL